MKKGKLWSVLFLALALLTVWAVVSGNESFSLPQLMETLQTASAGWMIAAAAGMLGFIVFEGMAILCIARALGYRRGFGKGFLYSAADIYFSAITPSATGGQPASAYFMIKDGIPGAVSTITLVLNLIMYTLALLTVGFVGFLLRPSIFFHFHLLGRVLIVLGYLILIVLAAAFFMLIVKPRILERISLFFLRIGKKLHIVRREREKQHKLYHVMKEYRECAAIMADHKAMFVKAYLFNLLQRVSQISVTAFVDLGIGGQIEKAPDIWLTQSFVTIGTYSIPIPGGMGVADYLLIDGFREFFNEAEAINLELISRGLSFYICMIVSAVTVLIGFLYTIQKKKRVMK